MLPDSAVISAGNDLTLGHNFLYKSFPQHVTFVDFLRTSKRLYSAPLGRSGRVRGKPVNASGEGFPQAQCTRECTPHAQRTKPRK